MYSCCKPQLRLLGRESQLHLLTCFVARHPFKLACTHLPGQLLLEGERTPGRPWFDLLGTQPQQQQISHEGDGHRALHSPGVLSDLLLSQPGHSLEFFEAEFDVAVATPKSIPLVVQTRVYKLKRNMGR